MFVGDLFIFQEFFKGKKMLEHISIIKVQIKFICLCASEQEKNWKTKQ